VSYSSAGARSWSCGVVAEVGQSGAPGTVAGRVQVVSEATAGARLTVGYNDHCN
jgi:hypothetical protein